jgi:probable phosphoglycerate mutase
VDRVLARVRERLTDGDVALFAHGHVLRVLTARWLGLAAEGGALLPLRAGSYGVLGFERERQVLSAWALH